MTGGKKEETKNESKSNVEELKKAMEDSENEQSDIDDTVFTSEETLVREDEEKKAQADAPDVNMNTYGRGETVAPQPAAQPEQNTAYDGQSYDAAYERRQAYQQPAPDYARQPINQQPAYNAQPQDFGAQNAYGAQPQNFGGQPAYNAQPQGFGGQPAYNTQPPAYNAQQGYGGYAPRNDDISFSTERTVDDNETTVISRNTVIDGNVRSFANMNIDGNIKGDVETTKNIVLNGKIVGNIAGNNASLLTSQVQGNVRMKGRISMERDTLLIGDVGATYANINGKIKGNLDIGGKAELKSDAVVFGDISASTITVNDGAIIQGYVSTTFLNKEESKNIFPDAITINE